MLDMRENPLGLNGFAFVEFTGPDVAEMGRQLEQLGFVAASHHPQRDIVRYRQGGIDFLLNRETSGQAATFRAAHGPSANGMAFRVTDAARAYEIALANGARPADAASGALGEDSYVLSLIHI